MWERIRVIFTIPELRNKILLTLLLLAIYRIGWQVPLPVVNPQNLSVASGSSGGFSRFIEYAAIFSGSRLQQATIFGLGIMPYISASIIFQLLGTVWKPLEDLQKEGEAGRKKINEYTRYATVILCIIQSAFYVWFFIMNEENGVARMVTPALRSPETGNLGWGWQIAAVLMMTSGTIFLMWLGEQIDEYGIGNGISLLIMAGILAQMPAAGWTLLTTVAKLELVGLFNGDIGIEALILLAVSFVAVVFGVVFITLGQRRIPTQSAKHVRGRRVYGGSRQYLPIKINQSGVMPIIFAGSLLMFPQILCSWLGNWIPWFGQLAQIFGSQTSVIYNLLYVATIYFFCYFWTAIIFNPKDMADNLKNMGTFIPGYRPGKRTGDYLEQVMVRITYVGAAFLALVAIIPTVISSTIGVDFMISSFFGGTGLLIAVSVAFDLVQKIDSHLVMRNYPGLLES